MTATTDKTSSATNEKIVRNVYESAGLYTGELPSTKSVTNENNWNRHLR